MRRDFPCNSSERRFRQASWPKTRRTRQMVTAIEPLLRLYRKFFC